VTRHVSKCQWPRVLPSDAGSVRWKVEVAGGALLKRPEEEKGFGWLGSGAQAGAFGQLRYLSPPGHSHDSLDRDAAYTVAAYLA
jgi:hypothetical protein